MFTHLHPTHHKDAIGQTIHIGDVVAFVTSSCVSHTVAVVTKSTPKQIRTSKGHTSASSAIVITSNLLAMNRKDEVDKMRAATEFDYTDPMLSKPAPPRYMVFALQTDGNSYMISGSAPVAVIITHIAAATNGEVRKGVAHVKALASSHGLKANTVWLADQQRCYSANGIRGSQWSHWKTSDYTSGRMGTLSTTTIRKFGLDQLPLDQVIPYDEFKRRIVDFPELAHPQEV